MQMMNHTTALEEKLILTSHSIDNLFDYCPRKFEFMTMFERRPKREGGFAAMVGDAVHAATQAWLIARAEGKDDGEAANLCYWALAKNYPWELEAIQSNPGLRSWEMTVSLQHEVIRSPVWENLELVKVEDRGWAVEVPFLIRHDSMGKVNIKNLGIEGTLATQGKIDLIMRDTRTGKIKTIDIKSTGLADSVVEKEFAFSGQQIGYTHVVNAMLGIDPAEFEVLYLIAQFRSPERPHVFELPIAKDEEDIRDYWMGKIDRLSRIQAYSEAGWFPRTNGGCHAFNKPCACFDICHTRDVDTIRKWYAFTESEPVVGYDYWVELSI